MYPVKLLELSYKYQKLNKRITLKQKLIREFVRAIEKSCKKVLGYELSYDPLHVVKKSVEKEIVILSPRTSLPIAYAIEKFLKKYSSHKISVSFNKPQKYVDKMYIIMDEYIFENLPKTYMVVHTKDLDSDSFFKSNHLRILDNAVAIITFSIQHIEILQQNKFSYNHIYWVPLDGYDNYEECKFEFYLGRCFLAYSIINIDNYMDSIRIFEKEELEKTTVISLPETTARRKILLNNNYCESMSIFDGLRHNTSWIGCAFSYKYLCYWGYKYELSYMTICEDDMIETEGFQDRYSVVKEFLFEVLGTDRWDVFVGVLAEVDKDVVILDVIDYKGVRFVFMNKMVSMVFNIYSNRILGVLARWWNDEENTLPIAIDRYLGSHYEGLIAVVVLPFLVAHDEAESSTLWGNIYEKYSERIDEAQIELLEKVRQFEIKKG